MHVGLIPDGNRRFMSKQGIKDLLSSYDMGIRKFYDFLDWCYDLGVDEVTIYALSIENLQSRDKTEVDTLFKVFNQHAINGLTDERIHSKKIRVNVCGDRGILEESTGNRRLATQMLSNLRKLEESTKDHDSFTLNLAIAYGGRQEIISSVKKIIESGGEITEDSIMENLWVKGCPDLIIRTSEDRLSNFLIWQGAYSEIYFVKKLWQEFSQKDIKAIIEDYKKRDRRYGK
jgi:tritrans,polycis-undecaprenyl-diphosphate synthase [geranylgeranyl-diphosphate specific]